MINAIHINKSNVQFVLKWKYLLVVGGIECQNSLCLVGYLHSCTLIKRHVLKVNYTYTVNRHCILIVYLRNIVYPKKSL